MELIGKVSESEFIIKATKEEISQCAGFYNYYANEMEKFFQKIGNKISIKDHYTEAASILGAFKDIGKTVSTAIRSIEILRSKLEKQKLKYFPIDGDKEK